MQDEYAEFRVGERLRQVVLARGQTLKRFAEQAGIAYRSFQDYLSGKNKPGFEQLQKLARMGIDVGFLLTGRATTNYPTHLDHEFYASTALAADDELKELIYWELTAVVDRAISHLNDEATRGAPTTVVFQLWADAVRLATACLGDMDRSLCDLREKGVPALSVAQLLADAVWSKLYAAIEEGAYSEVSDPVYHRGQI